MERRILVNFRIDPQILAPQLPAPFKPKVVNGYALGSVCLVKLKNMCPHYLPITWGPSSENSAHRFLVEWETQHQHQEAVYITRRDTNSFLNQVIGGTLFPGEYIQSYFKTQDTKGEHQIEMKSRDHQTKIFVKGQTCDSHPNNSVYPSLEAAETEIRKETLGYSKTKIAHHFDGVRLHCRNFNLQSFKVQELHCSFFNDTDRFPEGSIDLDSAFLMKEIDHTWEPCPSLIPQSPTFYRNLQPHKGCI